MGERRQGREAAVQLLYQMEFSCDRSDAAQTLFWDSLPDKLVDGREFAGELVRAVLERVEEIDGLIDTVSSNWHLDRIARIDLSILRLGVGELIAFREVPAEVVIDEAVELARKYSDSEAPAFVNGILDRIAVETDRLKPGPRRDKRSPGGEDPR